MSDVEEPVVGQDAKLENLKNNSSSGHGGARSGAGRPKGSISLEQKERLAIRKAFEDRIHNNADRLLNAALTKALGESFLMHKYTVGSGTKARTVIDVVEDLDTIIAFLNDELNNSGDDDWYYISTKPVDMVAVKELYDRAFGKPMQKAEIGGPDGTPLAVTPEQAEQLLKLRSVRAAGN